MKEEVNYTSLSRQKSKNNDCEKCMKSWIKTLLLFFNILLMAGSIGVIIYFSIYFYKRESYVAILVGSNLFIAYYLLIVSGVALIIIVTIAFIGIGKNIIKIIYTYVILLALVFLLEALSVGLAIYYGSFFMDVFKMDLKETMTVNYKQGNTQIIEATDYLQIKYKCCGSEYYTDWIESGFENQQNLTNPKVRNRVPESCCRSRVQGCGQITHPSNIYHQGCVSKFYETLSKNLSIVQYIALGCLVAQLLGIIMGSVLIVLLEKDVKYRKNYHDSYTKT